MVLPELTEAMVRRVATTESFERGSECYNEGAVLSLILREDVLHASVEASNPQPYTVRCIFDERGVASATCSCPYDRGGWCKHIVATLLIAIHNPEMIEKRPPLANLLSGLDREQLQSLLLKLVGQAPSLQETIEEQVKLLNANVNVKVTNAAGTGGITDSAGATHTGGTAGASKGAGSGAGKVAAR